MFVTVVGFALPAGMNKQSEDEENFSTKLQDDPLTGKKLLSQIYDITLCGFCQITRYLNCLFLSGISLVGSVPFMPGFSKVEICQVAIDLLQLLIR